MTVIAWDGKTLAADKQSTFAGMRHTTTKIRRLGDGSLAGAAGDTGLCRELIDWYEKGADPTKYPDKEKKCDFVVITPKREVLIFDGSPARIHIEDGFYACGSGRDYAVAAMHLGKTALEAVQVACIFDVACGMGTEALEMN